MRFPHITCLAAVALAVLLAACGDTVRPEVATAPPAPLVGPSDPVLSTLPDPHPDPVTTTLRPVRARPPQFGTDHDEASTSAAVPIDPCTLVPAATVRRVAGRYAARHLGKQGPTCIYTLRTRPVRILTIALQPGPLPAAARSRATIRTRVAGRRASCLRRPPVTLLVPAGAGRLLAVGAPCPIAARLAASALRRVRR